MARSLANRPKVRRRNASDSVDGSPIAPPAPGRRERMVQAMIELCAHAGYPSVSIAQVSSRARVSSSTFYEQFADKEDCMLAAYRAAVRRLLESMPLELADGGWTATLQRAVETLLEGFAREPDAARAILIEARAPGARLDKARRRAAGTLEERLEAVLDHPSDDSLTLDLPAVALIGGVRAIVTRHLRAYTEAELPALAGDVIVWLESYAIPDRVERWSTGPHALLAAAAVKEPARVPGTVKRLPRGRHRLPAGVVARSQRTRLMHSTAEVMMRKGYADTTVSDIVATAGVARDVFYEHFANKHQAFLETQQHSTQDILDACAAAYFAAEDWPERMWGGLETLLRLIAENPALAHLRLVECYAAGGTAVRRAEDITRSFTIFLEEGYRYRDQARELPHLCSTAITGAIFEVVQRQVAAGATGQLPTMLPLLAYLAIAPFTGPAEAVRRIEKLRAGRRRPARV